MMNYEPMLIFFTASFSALFTIVNPFSTASVFLTIARKNSIEERKQMAKKAAITATVVLILFALLGKYILGFFNITIDAFKIAGGIIISSIGMRMLYKGKSYFYTEEQKKEAIDKDDVSIIPLAIPMLSGPGAITTAIVFMGKTNGITDIGILIVSIILVCLISYFVVSRAHAVDNYIGKMGKNVIDKIMGLIVLVIGVQFVINGISAIVQNWIAVL